eukprot:2164980-Amphidinium_carterae.1
MGHKAHISKRWSACKRCCEFSMTLNMVKVGSQTSSEAGPLGYDLVACLRCYSQRSHSQLVGAEALASEQIRASTIALL